MALRRVGTVRPGLDSIRMVWQVWVCGRACQANAFQAAEGAHGQGWADATKVARRVMLGRWSGRLGACQRRACGCMSRMRGQAVGVWPGADRLAPPLLPVAAV